MSRLSLATLGRAAPGVGRPRYDPARAGTAIVHLGVGNFHRAHQAAYTDDAMAGGDTGWGIVGVSLRSAATRDALAAQDGLYTLIERDARGDRARSVGAVRELLVAPASPQAVVARIAARATRIVSLTITEKGYCRAGPGGGLDLGAPEIAHDLGHPERPASAIGLLQAAAVRRLLDRAPGFTVLSCDNLAGNGRITRELVLQFDDAIAVRHGATAAARPAGLRAWIERELAFPDAMVDRIVPHTSAADRALARALSGLDDAWPVATEPFRQWVIEDRFAAGRPQWQHHGAQFVDDVSSWETMKLRLLNAAHSALAYLGVVAGLATVDRAIAEPALRGFIEAMWRDEVVPTLPAAVRAQAGPYCAALLARFANPALAHRTRQIAMDGSQKLPLRLVPTLRARLAANQPAQRVALAIAAWIRFLEGRTEAGERYAIDDPMSARLAEGLAAAGAEPRAAAAALLRVEPVFGAELRENAAALEAIATQLAAIRALGCVGAARATIAQ